MATNDNLSKKTEVPVRNLPYIQHDDPRYHEAITDLKSHLESLKFTVTQQAATISDLQKGKSTK